jgi:hypothetical protein
MHGNSTGRPPVCLVYACTNKPHLFGQFTIIVGDLSYADGDQLRWDRWSNLFEPLFSSRPFQVSAP